MSGFKPKVTNAGGGGPNNQSAEDAEQEAAERNLIRRCVDYHGPAVLDCQDRLFRKACRSHHVRNHRNYHLQPHSSHLRAMGMPLSTVALAPIASEFYMTWMAHVTRAKNSSAIICLSWTPGGRRLLTGNHEGEFGLWDGSEFFFAVFLERPCCAHHLCLKFAHNFIVLFIWFPPTCTSQL